MKKLLLLLSVCATSVFAQGGGTCSDANIGLATVTLTASGTTQVIAPVAGVSIHVCTLTIGSAAAVNITMQKTTSGGSSTNITGTYQSATGVITFPYNGALVTGLGNGFSINLSSAVNVGGSVTYFISHTT